MAVASVTLPAPFVLPLMVSTVEALATWPMPPAPLNTKEMALLLKVTDPGKTVPAKVTDPGVAAPVNESSKITGSPVANVVAWGLLCVFQLFVAPSQAVLTAPVQMIGLEIAWTSRMT